MTKKELTRIIKQNAKEQIAIYQDEIKAWSDEEMQFKYQGGIEGIKEFIINLQTLKIID